jgi:mannosyl-oligosaccharide alpha-1,2-mannosidase
MSLQDIASHDPAAAAAADAYLDLAQRLGSTCAQLALQSPSGLAPETVVFNPSAAADQPQFTVVKPSYHLRPEILESMFYLWRATKDEKYRQWGADIWRAIATACRTPSAYAALIHAASLLPSPFMQMQVQWCS